MAISAPVEAKDELAETGLEALGAQPLRLQSAVWIQARVSWAGLSPMTWGWWRSRGTALQPLQPSVLTIAVAAVLRTAKLPRPLALQDGILASRRLARCDALPSPSSTAPATGILPSGLRPGPGGAPLSRCGRQASSISTRPDSGLRSGLTMARRSLAASIQALRQDPVPSRFCNCRAEMPLQ